MVHLFGPLDYEAKGAPRKTVENQSAFGALLAAAAAFAQQTDVPKRKRPPTEAAWAFTEKLFVELSLPALNAPVHLWMTPTWQELF